MIHGGPDPDREFQAGESSFLIPEGTQSCFACLQLQGHGAAPPVPEHQGTGGESIGQKLRTQPLLGRKPGRELSFCQDLLYGALEISGVKIEGIFADVDKDRSCSLE